ncbi:MAG: hypothetical protein WA708_12880 [Acidobacteriaceae bacterium]
MTDPDKHFRLHVFWGNAVFSLGILWGISNVVYSPAAAMTSIVGSSWLEVLIVLAGGLLSLTASIGAFYRRRPASNALLLGGALLLLAAIAGQVLSPAFGAHGAINLLLLFLSGIVATALGTFGWITDRKGWPPLRGGR